MLGFFFFSSMEIGSRQRGGTRQKRREEEEEKEEGRGELRLLFLFFFFFDVGGISCGADLTLTNCSHT